MDRENVIKGLRCIKGDLILCVDCAYSDENGHGTYSCKQFCANDAISLLKEQQQQIWEFQDQVEYLTDKQKEQKFLVDSDGKITPLPVVVRCKDCKKRFTVHCIQEEAGNINNQDDWFCADGERKSD